jgi:type I restriction enzyme S subunit
MYYLWFASQSGQLSKYFTGTGIKHLTGQSLARVLVPTAERTTQDSIVAEIESRLSVCDNIERTVGIALQQAEALRQSILKIAFEGGL